MKQAHNSTSMSKVRFDITLSIQNQHCTPSSFSSSKSKLIYSKNILDFPFKPSSKYPPLRSLLYVLWGWLCDGHYILRLLVPSLRQSMQLQRNPKVTLQFNICCSSAVSQIWDNLLPTFWKYLQVKSSSPVNLLQVVYLYKTTWN